MSGMRVGYFYNSNISNYCFRSDHPMKQLRQLVTHDLIDKYGLLKYMKVYDTCRASVKEITCFHLEDYVALLQNVTPSNCYKYKTQMKKVCLDEQCPVFDGMFDYSSLVAGASLQAADELCRHHIEIAISWSGGMHHAKRSEASGFCYLNDAVLAILRLLAEFSRVLYIDIDIHHADGVQDAFYLVDRVCVCSFHQYGNGYFPESGHMDDVGAGKGLFFTVNVPLQRGMNDDSYDYVFKPIVRTLHDTFRPDVIVIQGGADTLAGDREGKFQLSIRGHGECMKLVKRFGIPLLILGGGGYKVSNVARCWTYETGLMVDQDLSGADIPETKFLPTFQPNFTLEGPPVTPQKNENKREFLDILIRNTCEKIRRTVQCPSVQFSYVDWPLIDTIMGRENEPQYVKYDYSYHRSL